MVTCRSLLETDCIRRWGGLCLVVAITLVVVQATAGAQRPAGTVLKSVQVAVDKGLTLVTIDADGALPLTVGRALEGPARIYFDLPNVSPMTGMATTVPGAGVVTRVRIALNSIAPNVTRVVLDLGARETFTVRAEERQAGRLHIVVGGDTSQQGPNQFTAASTMGTPPMAPAPARGVEAYREQFLGAVERIKVRRSVLAAIAADAEVPLEVLRAAQADFTDLRRVLEATTPPTADMSTRDLLIASCTFGAAAAGLRIETGRDGNPTAPSNAASAAAGSLMLLDKACADLGCPAAAS